jgi:hypothetical protein
MSKFYTLAAHHNRTVLKLRLLYSEMWFPYSLEDSYQHFRWIFKVEEFSTPKKDGSSSNFWTGRSVSKEPATSILRVENSSIWS